MAQNQTVEMELTKEELIQVRVAMLGRLDKLRQLMQEPDEILAEHARKRYDFCIRMMSVSGKLWDAMIAFQDGKPGDVL